MLRRISLLVVVFCVSSLGAALAEVGRNAGVVNPNTVG